ncbi:MAG TPA: F0F1 ATP synthase subunit alpha, partial [Kiloniellales bacterium]|nr:F0F1 ATP synthase subunit alpha [Kiloniellales bacterium]
SDLDASTQRLLQRGERLTELLKQPQYRPLPVEEQVCVIYAGVRGYLDKLPVSQVGDFERKLLVSLREQGHSILESIRTTGDLTAETEEKLKAMLEDLSKVYA